MHPQLVMDYGQNRKGTRTTTTRPSTYRNFPSSLTAMPPGSAATANIFPRSAVVGTTRGRALYHRQTILSTCTWSVALDWRRGRLFQSSPSSSMAAPPGSAVTASILPRSAAGGTMCGEIQRPRRTSLSICIWSAARGWRTQCRLCLLDCSVPRRRDRRSYRCPNRRSTNRLIPEQHWTRATLTSILCSSIKANSAPCLHNNRHHKCSNNRR